LQTKGNCANHEELDLQRSSISKEEQQEDFLSLYAPFTSNLDKKDDNDEEDHANVISNHPFYDEYDEDIEVLDRKFHDQQKPIVGELYSNLFIEQEKTPNCFDSQIDSSQTVDTLKIILDVSNSHGRDNFTAQNHYENMPIFMDIKKYYSHSFSPH